VSFTVCGTDEFRAIDMRLCLRLASDRLPSSRPLNKEGMSSSTAPYGVASVPLTSHPYLQANNNNNSSGKAHAQKDRPSTKKSSTADWDTTKPDVSFVSPTVASLVMRKFLSSSLTNEGFLSAESSAMYRLEQEVTAFVEQIYGRAKGYAEVASRAKPIPEDVLLACEEYDLDFKELRKESRKRRRNRKNIVHASRLEAPSFRSDSPELLDSDDEKSRHSAPHTIRSLHPHLPPLPPKHTYLRTPAPTTKKQAIPSLEKKLENAARVQTSLKHLLTLTEDGVDKNDVDLYGGVVNWESTRQPRKKWKV